MVLAVWSIKRLCKCINAMMDNQFDCVMFIEGKRGLGKSTFGNAIGYRVKAKFKPRRDVAFSREDVIKLLGEKTKGIILADELINVAYNRDFWDNDQKTLIKALNMYRDRCNLFIGCIPSFVDLDKQMQKLCKIRVTILRRGYALLQFQTKTLYSNDPWDVTTNRKIEQKFRPGKMHYHKFSTVKGILKFNDLTPNQRELYEEIKEEKRGQVFAQYHQLEEKTNPLEILLGKIKEGLVSKQALKLHCEVNGLKQSNTRIRLNQMLRDGDSDKTLKNYIKDEVEMVKDKINTKTTKKTRKFELISTKSKEIRENKKLLGSNDDHKTINYGNQHVWAR